VGGWVRGSLVGKGLVLLGLGWTGFKVLLVMMMVVVTGSIDSCSRMDSREMNG